MKKKEEFKIMRKDDVLSFLKKHGYTYTEYIGKWQGLDVYTMDFDDDQKHYVGMAKYALVDNNEIFICSYDDARKITKELLADKYEDDEDDEFDGRFILQ